MKNLSTLLVIVILSSCASRNDVVHRGFLQKRKYNKGYHLTVKKNNKHVSKQEKQELAQEDVERYKEVEEEEKVEERLRAKIQEANEVALEDVILEANNVREEGILFQEETYKTEKQFFLKLLEYLSYETISLQDEPVEVTRTDASTDKMRKALAIVVAYAPVVAILFPEFALIVTGITLLLLGISLLVDSQTGKGEWLIDKAFEDKSGMNWSYILGGLVAMMVTTALLFSPVGTVAASFFEVSRALFVSEGLPFLLASVAVVTFWLWLVKRLNAYIRLLNERIAKNQKPQQTEEKKPSGEENEKQEKANDKYEKHIFTSQMLTYFCFILPFIMIIPAWIANLVVILDYKGYGDKSARNKAALRMFLAVLFSFIGLTIILSITG